MKRHAIKILSIILMASLIITGCSSGASSGNITHENTSTPKGTTPATSATEPKDSTETTSTDLSTPSTTPTTTTSPTTTVSPAKSSTPSATKSPDKTKQPTNTSSSNKTPTQKPSPTPTTNPSIKPVSISWPKGQALPHFSTPASTLDTILIQNMNHDEKLTFTALQGLINKRQPRILILDSGADEGTYTWPNTSTVNLRSRKLYTSTTKYDLIEKYAHELKGVVLYSTSKSYHYRNLAGTIAGIKDAIPVTQSVYNKIKDKGIELNVVVDLTKLNYSSTIDIYNYLYNNYWKDCDKRLLLSGTPHNGGDMHGTRDVQVAAGAAVVFLDNMNSSERAVYEKFLKDMKAGEAVVLGWYTSERSGVTTATKYGIGTIPSNFFISGTVYGGQDHTIKIPKAPPKPKLENKVYIAVYISDGDNIQYNQRAMRKIWDQSKSARGKVAMNWTIAPALVDIAPGLLNYYYTTATDKEYFVAGPSGMGYIMPYNTLPEPGAPGGEHISESSKSRLDAYVKLTNEYMKKAGLNVITVWDNLTPWQRQSYSDLKNSPDILGVTVQQFDRYGRVTSGVVNNMYFDKLLTPYSNSYAHMIDTLSHEIENWDGKSPKFVSYQVQVWGFSPSTVVQIHNELKSMYGNQFEFVRADHYFELFYEANNIKR